jgi:hypothetical protein
MSAAAVAGCGAAVAIRITGNGALTRGKGGGGQRVVLKPGAYSRSCIVYGVCKWLHALLGRMVAPHMSLLARQLKIPSLITNAWQFSSTGQVDLRSLQLHPM